MTTLKRERLDDALLEALRSATGQPIGDADIPTGDTDPLVVPDLPYGIWTPLFVEGDHGSMENADDLSFYHYQMTCVGEDRRQASWMSRRVQETMTNVVGSQYATRVVGSGFLISWRQLVQLGPIVREGQLFNAVDTYLVAAQPQ